MKKIFLLTLFLLLGLSAYAQEKFLADRHVERYKLACTSCHDPATPSELKQILGRDVCVSCHGDYDKVYKLTIPKNEAEGNPHAQHDGLLPCTECHHGHKPGTNYCSECHTWDFKTP